MTLGELQRLDSVQAAQWTHSEAQLVFSELLGWSLTEQILKADEPISDAICDCVIDIARRSVSGEPLAYILGATYFDGLRLGVTPDVLIPRPDTEVLVDVASQLIAEHSLQTIHDLCTGSGAVALALKHRRAACAISASDISKTAIVCASNNAQLLNLPIACHEADLFNGLESFDLVTANPPYIANDDAEIDDNVRAFEPSLALFAEQKGLAVIIDILTTAKQHINPNGYLCLEHGHRQAHDIQTLATDLGWQRISTHQDLAGRDRVTWMQMP